MKLSFHLILTLAAMLTMAQTAWATDPVTKTYAFSTRSLENNNSTLKMTDPDDKNRVTIITATGLKDVKDQYTVKKYRTKEVRYRVK